MNSSRRVWLVATMSVVIAVMTLTGPWPGEAQGVREREVQARELFDREQYLQAAEALQQILRRDPENRTANVLLPFALARLNNARGAIAQIRRALELLPDHLKLQLLLAGLLAQQEVTIGESVALYQGVLARDPDNQMARLGLAEAYVAQGRTLDAIQEFAALTGKFPNEPRYWVRLGQLYGSLGDLREARKDFEHAYALAPDNADAVRSLALLSDVGDMPQDALRYYQELRALYPNDVIARFEARAAEERLAEPQLPASLDQIEGTPLEVYQKAAATNSKQLHHRRAQLEATRLRSATRFLPSFYFAPSFGSVAHPDVPSDRVQNFSFSFGWNLADLVTDPYKINITGMQADMESVTSNILADVSSTYYQRLQIIAQYRQLQRQLAFEPQNIELRQSKQTMKYTLLNLIERMKLLTGIP